MCVAEMELKPSSESDSAPLPRPRHDTAVHWGSAGARQQGDEAAGEPSLFPLFHQEIFLLLILSIFAL